MDVSVQIGFIWLRIRDQSSPFVNTVMNLRVSKKKAWNFLSNCATIQLLKKDPAQWG
jgi:hypothetical protein